MFVDARPPRNTPNCTLAGRSISPGHLEKEGARRPLAGSPEDRELVVYCGQLNCDVALKAAEKLESLGFTRCVGLFGGVFRVLDEAGYPADTGR